jgi:hypothetical protein
VLFYLKPLAEQWIYMDKTLNLLKTLTEAHGVPGYEGPVREIVRNYFQPLGETTQDKTGNLICKKAGGKEAPDPRTLLTADHGSFDPGGLPFLSSAAGRRLLPHLL